MDNCDISEQIMENIHPSIEDLLEGDDIDLLVSEFETLYSQSCSLKYRVGNGNVRGRRRMGGIRRAPNNLPTDSPEPTDFPALTAPPEPTPTHSPSSAPTATSAIVVKKTTKELQLR